MERQTSGSNQLARASIEVWQTYSIGENLVLRVDGSGSSARTNRNSYDAEGKLLEEDRADGSWAFINTTAKGASRPATARS